jgi:hypothetical protein
MKTRKTASTSVEVYFEPFCLPEGEWSFQHSRGERVSESGIVGARGDDTSGSTWYNHMPAREAQEKIERHVWEDYFKFCTVRNPFEKVVSEFYHNRRTHLERGGVRGALEVIAKKARLSKVVLRTQFEIWLRSARFRTSRDKYFVEGECCMNDFIRFEELESGIERICAETGVPFQEDRIPHLKDRDRTRPSVADHYNDRSRGIVEEAFKYEIQRFGYAFPTEE